MALALLASLACTATVSAATPGPLVRSSGPDLRTLEKDVLTAVNAIRQDPAAVARNLTAARSGAVATQARDLDGVTRTFLKITLPDGTTTLVKAGYLDSAITTAQGLAALGPVVWSPGLHTVTRTYAELDPTGHTWQGTTLGGRAAAEGDTGVSPAENPDALAESINYGGATGTQQAYELFIDSGVSDVGHRRQMINPTFTHLGVGCFGPNRRYGETTCVLNYADRWIEKADLPVLVVNQQYAVREKSGQFRYFVYDGTDRSGNYRFQVCPKQPGQRTGTLSTPAIGSVTTAESAAAMGLTATNVACSTADFPSGLLANGGSLPGTAPVGSGTSGPTATTPNATTPTATAPTAASDTGPPALVVGRQYALQESDSTFRYFRYQGMNGRAHRFALCPAASGYENIDTNDLSIVLTTDTAKARNLTAPSLPCVVDGAGQVTYQIPQLQAGTQYAVPENGTTTFRYATFTGMEGRKYGFAWCPDATSRFTAGYPDQAMNVDYALAAGLKATSAPCAGSVNGR